MMILYFEMQGVQTINVNINHTHEVIVTHTAAEVYILLCITSL
jgi:hypothetical protein